MRNLFLLLFFTSFLLLSCEDRDKTFTQKISKMKETPFQRGIIKHKYYEYREGNLPLIIVVPHAGRLEDKTLVKRNESNCLDPNLNTRIDMYIPQMCEIMDSMLYAQTGMYPHYIKLNLQRAYLDLNRPRNYATVNGCAKTQALYDEIYGLINEIQTNIGRKYGAGLLLSMHSRVRDTELVELGYLIVADQMNMSDDEIDASFLVRESSIFNLSIYNRQQTSFSKIMRGEFSFGTMLSGNGVPCIPSMYNPKPELDKYYSGANIIKEFGPGDMTYIDAIQMIFNKESRYTTENRHKTAQAVVDSFVKFMETNYLFK